MTFHFADRSLFRLREVLAYYSLGVCHHRGIAMPSLLVEAESRRDRMINRF